MIFVNNLKRYLVGNLKFIYKIIFTFSGIVLPVALVLFVIYSPWDSLNFVRYSGLALELLGVATVAINLRGKRVLFSKPNFLVLLKNLLNARTKWKPVIRSVSASFNSSSSIFASKVNVLYASSTNTIEDRLLTAEKNISILHDDMLAFETDIYKKQVDVVKIMQVQQQAHDSAVQEIKTLMEDMAAKNISFEALGVYWLFWGLILSSIPNEILHILKYLT